MARQVVVVEWCDPCLADESEVPASWSAVIRIGDLERELMLCEQHYGEIIGELPQLLEKFGTQVEPPAPYRRRPTEEQEFAKPAKVRQCPVCGVTRSSGPTVANHIWRQHIGRDRPAAPAACPDCGWTAEPDAKNPTSAVGKHRQSAHGFDPLAEAAAEYEAMKTQREHPYDVAVTRKRTPPELAPELLSELEAAKRAGVNKNVIAGCVRRGTLRSYHTPDGHVQISVLDLAEWAAEREIVLRLSD
jgi:predicted RNA-binding Zn-ribbon protein involved in translation (DUF1610 family)